MIFQGIYVYCNVNYYINTNNNSIKPGKKKTDCRHQKNYERKTKSIVKYKNAYM